jgi:ribosomal protein L40E
MGKEKKMGFLRKLFKSGHGEGDHRRRGQERNEHYRPDDCGGDEWRGRHPGSIPPLPPDSVCPQCQKSNPPGTRVCRQCDTPIDTPQCARCGAALGRGDVSCMRCGNRF